MTRTLPLLWTDCQSLLDHLLSRNALALQEQRLAGYVGILQEALVEKDIIRLFHISGLINPTDGLTKLKQPKELDRWMREGVVFTEPGVYGERAEARKTAAAELRAEVSRRQRLGVPVPTDARQLRLSEGVLALLGLLTEEQGPFSEEW